MTDFTVMALGFAIFSWSLDKLIETFDLRWLKKFAALFYLFIGAFVIYASGLIN